jgi:hypothetical protein
MIVKNAFEKKKSGWNLADYCNAPVYKEKKHTLSIQKISKPMMGCPARAAPRPTILLFGPSTEPPRPSKKETAQGEGKTQKEEEKRSVNVRHHRPPRQA